MAKQRFELMPDERILLKGSSVRHHFMSAYTDELVLTNKALIHVDLGLFNNHKGTTRYMFDNVSQVIIGEAFNGEKQLEVYHDGNMDDFAFQSGNDHELKVWELAINDQLSGRGDVFDAQYYSDLMEAVEREGDEEQREELAKAVDASFIGGIAKSVLSSGDISARGVMRGVKKQAFAKAATGVMSGMGIDIESETQGARQRTKSASTFKQKMEYAQIERRQLAEQAAARQKEPAPESAAQPQAQPAMSLSDQAAALKSFKELLDMGVITQEEFDKKKRQIMDL